MSKAPRGLLENYALSYTLTYGNKKEYWGSRYCFVLILLQFALYLSTIFYSFSHYCLLAYHAVNANQTLVISSWISFFDNIPTPADFKLGPGDEITLSLWGATNSRETFNINKSGQIYYKNIGFL